MNQTTTITTSRFPSIAFRSVGTGPALMLLHGFPASGNLWEPIVATLSETCQLIIPDIPGAGESRLGTPTVSIDELAGIVPALLDHLNLDKCILAGHSMGGYIALAGATLYPERLNGLALVHSTAVADDDAKKEKRRKSIALIEKGGREEFVKGMIPALFSEAFQKAHPDQVKAMVQEGLKLPAESMIAFYQAMIARPDRQGILKDLDIPVQWVLGREDTTIPWQSVLQQTSMADVSFVVTYENCGHMAMIEQPDALANELHRFTKYCARRTEASLL